MSNGAIESVLLAENFLDHLPIFRKLVHLKLSMVIGACTIGALMVIQDSLRQEEWQYSWSNMLKHLACTVVLLLQQNEALGNLIKEPFLPLMRSTRNVQPRSTPNISAMLSQSGSSKTKKFPMPETSESGDVENIEDALALLALSSPPFLDDNSSGDCP